MFKVWQNDGLPAQICNKCSAKLHISFQFKKQCERSDAKLRQYVAKNSNTANQQVQEQQQQQEQQSQPQLLQQQHQEHYEIQHQQPQVEHLPQHIHHVTQDIKMPQANNCLYVECAPLVDLQQDQNGFIQASQLNYNIQQQNHVPINGYGIQTVAPVQVYNGGYTMPLQQMQPTNLLHNEVIAPAPVVQPQPPLVHHQQQIIQTLPEHIEQTAENKEKQKRGSKGRKEVKNDETSKQCSTCNKVFPTTAKLSRHMKTHSTDMPYKCKLCSKAFSHSGNYKIHLRMHTDERPFKCSVCGKGCRQAQDLEKHIRTHTGKYKNIIQNILETKNIVL